MARAFFTRLVCPAASIAAVVAAQEVDLGAMETEMQQVQQVLDPQRKSEHGADKRELQSGYGAPPAGHMCHGLTIENGRINRYYSDRAQATCNNFETHRIISNDVVHVFLCTPSSPKPRCVPRQCPDTLPADANGTYTQVGLRIRLRCNSGFYSSSWFLGGDGWLCERDDIDSLYQPAGHPGRPGCRPNTCAPQIPSTAQYTSVASSTSDAARVTCTNSEHRVAGHPWSPEAFIYCQTYRWPQGMVARNFQSDPVECLAPCVSRPVASSTLVSDCPAIAFNDEYETDVVGQGSDRHCLYTLTGLRQSDYNSSCMKKCISNPTDTATSSASCPPLATPSASSYTVSFVGTAPWARCKYVLNTETATDFNSWCWQTTGGSEYRPLY